MKVFETETCTGCKTCEVACSFHHRQVFSNSISSIKIIPREETLGFAVGLYEKDDDGHLACDGCGGKTPLCIKYCPTIAKAELSNIIKEFQRSSKVQRKDILEDE